MPGQPLIPVPVLHSDGGKLQATVILGDEQEWMTARVPDTAPSSNSRSQCQPQWVRTFREFGATSRMASAPYGTYAKEPHAPFAKVQYALPRPGPTLRARVGDLIQLTFINQINPGDFPQSMDRGETGAGGGCDESSAGPNGSTMSYPGADKYPDCFHGSSTGNIHFHGTHTNPNATADNVFIEVRPSLIVKGKPVVTPQSVASSFQDFFRRCEVELSYNVLREWPTTWNDLPAAWTTEQKWLLQRYDAEMQQKYPGARKLWPVDEEQIKQGAWPQYYIGAFPYCFRLPEYKQTKWPPAAPMQMDGAGTAEMPADGDVDNRSLIMGQSPGTHWYHAHKHGSTAINVANGMTGAFIIEGQYDDDLNTWYGSGWTRTQPVLVINQLGVSPNLMRGGAGQDKGADFSINGQIQPKIQMYPGEVQMWRIVNTSGRASVLFTGPPSGFEWKQLAQDGVQFIDANYQSHANKPFLLAPGNRADILVKAPAGTCAIAGGCSSPVIVKNEVDPLDLVGKNPANPLTLLTVNVSGTAPKTATPNNSKFIPTAPYFPPFLADIADSEVKGTKVITFSSDTSQPVQHKIDGKQFDGEVGAVVLLNQAEEWKIVNETYGGRIVSHPFHIHINPFQITEVFSPNDTLPDPTKPDATIPKYIFDDQARKSPDQCYLDPTKPETWNPKGANPLMPCPTHPQTSNLIWWDVFPIPSGIKATDAAGNPIMKINPETKKPEQVMVPGYFKMRSRFVDYPGFYVIHCHILAHEDRGMMTIVEVAPARTPYSHH
jgi:FtsP/CotA-like multicopper oxidase with cupredoxin domain